MLEKVISISGKPGLFKIVANSPKMLLVEDVTTKRRFPAHSRDKIVALGDIAMYTDGEDMPLNEILEKLYKHLEEKTVDAKTLNDKAALREIFGQVVADYDRERVHDSDIRKLFQWYNTLVAAGLTDFEIKRGKEGEEEEEKSAD